MKRLSLQWRITLMSVLLIGVTCISMNLLLCSSGMYYMDTIANTFQGGTVLIDGEGEVSFDPQLIAPDEDLTIIVDGAQGRFRTTNWYITLVDRGYLTTRDAVGNCYYGSILHFDLRSDAANDYADGVPEGTFAVRNGQSGVGIWGGDNAACTSFLAEYFSGSPAIGKLTEGNVTIARDGEWYEISFDGLTLAGSDQTSLTGSYEGRVQYIDARE